MWSPRPCRKGTAFLYRLPLPEERLKSAPGRRKSRTGTGPRAFRLLDPAARIAYLDGTVNLLLTGHEGYVGSRLKTYFESRGHRVVGWGRKEDLMTLDAGVLRGNAIDLVVHNAAAMERTKTGYALGGADERVNVLGTRQLLLALAEVPLPLVHISTKDVYGEVYGPDDIVEEPTRLMPRFPLGDDLPFNPSTVYAQTKLMGEFIAMANPRTNVVRLTTCYTGDVHPRGHWILHFARSSLRGQGVRLTGTGRQIRDPLHADDLGALVLAMAEKNVWGFKMNAGGGLRNAHSIVEILDLIDPKLPREFVPGGDRGFIADNRRARELFGWEPSILVTEEIPRLLERLRRAEG